MSRTFVTGRENLGVLASIAVSRGRTTRAARIVVATTLLLGASLPMWGGRASGRESIKDLKARMDAAQRILDESTLSIEGLEDQLEAAGTRVEEIEKRVAELKKRDAKLVKIVVERARTLYMSGRGDMLEVLFGAETIGELSDAAEMLSQVNLQDSGAFVDLARTRAELVKLQEEELARKKDVERSYEALKVEAARVEAMYDALQDDYASLQDRTPAATVQLSGGSGMYCPVAGPTSFVDSWGAPRSGHTHQGVDMMGSYGTPLVAVTSGTITYAAYDGSGGNMIFLSGDDGNAYWYMHNQSNLVTGGHVSAGQQIATLGDTGNAAGTPHLHFEYHPGGGGPVNPTPLVSSLC